ncbi:hypothetical protein LSH36_160g02003 [Paralvinella palmiformis]|uniref:Uncharacterized protein n=1 Tax=Paralvinella palmiformis TaxID=53620 RepID=A0AAD9N8K2_9ANNE|nr:hypothetical protein LSH36_160g02003 [Paralvinella palmiformis]
MKSTMKRKSLSAERMNRNPPTLTLVVPPDREYARLLQQTKMVYDQLLIDKHSKLYQALMIRKIQYDEKCNELTKTNQNKALEFGVRAQEALNKMIHEFGEELMAQRTDYQQKLNNMYSQLEEKWKQENRSQPPEVPNVGPPCQVYPHK